MSKIKAKQVKSKECEEWIQSCRAVLRNDLREPGFEVFLDVYLLDDGGLLLRNNFEKRNGVLYENYGEYQKSLNKIAKNKKLSENYGISKDASFDNQLRISVKDFKEMLPQSPLILEDAFGFSPGSLDHSMESLRLLSVGMNKMMRNVDIEYFEKKYFILITAYCGEVMCKQVAGDWVIKGDEEGIVHQVLIVEKNRPERHYRPEIPLAKILAGDVPNRLGIEVDAQLYKYGFIKNEK